MPTDLEKSRISEINRLYGELKEILSDTFTTCLPKIICIGELLTEQKKSMKHGEWTPWIESNFQFEIRTAQRWMRVFQHRNEIKKNDTMSFLTDVYTQIDAIEEEKRREERHEKLEEWRAKRERWREEHPEEVKIEEERTKRTEARRLKERRFENRYHKGRIYKNWTEEEEQEYPEWEAEKKEEEKRSRAWSELLTRIFHEKDADLVNRILAESNFRLADPAKDREQSKIFSALETYFNGFPNTNQKMEAAHNVLRRLKELINSWHVELTGDTNGKE